MQKRHDQRSAGQLVSCVQASSAFSRSALSGTALFYSVVFLFCFVFASFCFLVTNFPPVRRLFSDSERELESMEVRRANNTV